MSAFKIWSDKLGELLKRAKQVSAQDDFDSRLALMDELSDFVVRSGPNTPDILALDALAHAAMIDLGLDTIDRRVSSIAARDGELVVLRKRFGGLSAEASDSAAAISLEKVNGAVTSLTGTVTSLKDLRASLTSGQHEQLAGQIKDTIEKVQALRAAVEALG